MAPVRLTARINEYVTAEQAASLLTISVATLWRWKAQGLLEGKPLLGRTVFERSKVEALAAKRNKALAAG